MHVIMAALGSIVTLAWLLYRLAEMGIDLGGLNPWAWRRRRQWRQAYEANPVYAVTSPMEATALLLAATAKADGDMSLDEKRMILGLFTSEFGLSERDAAGLLAASTHLLGRGDEVRDHLDKVLAPSRAAFTEAQARSAIAMLEQLAAIDGAPSSLKSDFVDRVRADLLPPASPTHEWR